MLRGTYRRDRHGDLPAGARVLPMPTPLKSFTLDVPEAPSDLSGIAAAKFAEMASMGIRVGEYPDLARIYCTTWAKMIEAERRLAESGPVLKGTGTRPFTMNPFVALSRQAMEDLTAMQNGPLFAVRATGAVAREPSRLARFNAAWEVER
jgi:hypothetical protein